MSTLIWVEIAFGVFLGLYVLFSVIGKTVDVLFAMRHTRRLRIGRRAFPIVSRPVLPCEDDGPGMYHVEGVLDRTGRQTQLDVDAPSASGAIDKAIERGVSPAIVTRKTQPAVKRGVTPAMLEPNLHR